ncbi:ExbD/TolR family protein [Roseateles cellulosilyticus]|uniref:Biopolymer transporter ExbD n=1 Tax=Pelomonas cellulosilytica TaxID=2906762 RepID=A0ABS8XU32_9BURK|nr:biopolymer transporter ExbD [Pelomonas sp. P8]MCE4556224.1 biopolymer transporter ExbD [Pelomonas sp. P8]
MGMKLSTSSGGPEPEALMDVNTTPLIDVMLVLLVMLILTIPIQLHSINLDIGTGHPTWKTKEPMVAVVEVDFDGTVTWNGQPLAGRTALDAKMQEVGALPPGEQPEVYIKPNRLVDYAAVAAVMGSAQRHRVMKMGMVGNERFSS